MNTISDSVVFFIGINPWIDTKNSKSSQIYKKKVGHCAMNTKNASSLEKG
jgi:hypothetical protein